MISFSPAIIAEINKKVVDTFPDVQGVYLFGSFVAETATKNSDVDLAVLLPHYKAKTAGNLALSSLHLRLEQLLERKVDLVNLRRVSTVLQNQVINNGILISNYHINAVQEFEMLTTSFYQKLNEERKGILDFLYKVGGGVCQGKTMIIPGIF